MLDLPNPPGEVVSDAGPDALLVTRRAEGRLVFSVWNPLTGADRPCAWVTEDAALAANTVHCSGSMGDGRRLIYLEFFPGPVRKGTQPEPYRSWTALFEPTSAEGPTLRLLRTTTSWPPIALRDDGALLVMPDPSGVEWWGPEPDQVVRIPFLSD